MARRKTDRETRETFIKEDDQLQLVDKSLEQELLEDQEVECLGQTFPSDTARREHYLKLLAEKLKDPEFRKTPGFPKGEDKDILRISDPPYYTACPNPFLEDFVKHHGRPYDPDEEYHREPFAVDVSEGKYDPLYRAHPYHTKVPHLAIVPSILHYTDPGDLVLDGFAGSGMTGVAAQWCGTAPKEYRRKLEGEWTKEGHTPPEWGARKAILGDLGPAATFIAANYNIPFDVKPVVQAAQRILDEVEEELGWMYETRHTDGLMGRINYTVWSEVFSCPECSGEVVFVEEALDKNTKRVKDTFPCPICGAQLGKGQLQRIQDHLIDPASGEAWQRIRIRPVLKNYSIDGETHETFLDSRDNTLLEGIEKLPLPDSIPTDRLPTEDMYHGSRIGPKGFTHAHHFFLPRSAQVLGEYWRKISSIQDTALRNPLLFALEQVTWTATVLNRYRPGSSFGNGPLRGVYYISSQIAEASVTDLFLGAIRRIQRGFPKGAEDRPPSSVVTTGDCAKVPIGNAEVDYVFTDPPFGENIFYADLNLLVEAWHKVFTDSGPEAIVDREKGKGTTAYQDLMRKCFEEYFRVLKPGRWMTVVFSNSRNSIWRAIQEAMGVAGFVVADVRTLDKKQGSYRQVTSSAVKQDLVISAYKPSTTLQERFELGTASAEGVWAFVEEHLSNVPIFVGRKDEVESIAERTPQMLLDRMIAFHVQRQMGVPMDSAEFLMGLDQRYPERDGMYFLPGQVVEYDRKRASAEKLRQLELFVSDEASAIQWVRQQLSQKPRTRQDLMPQFMKELKTWAKHEETVELQEILNQNFVLYEGRGPVPSQIHSYLSTQYKNLRGLEKDDPQLIRMASGRWYVPDPNKAGDLEKLRARALLKEFEEYKVSKKKLKQFRTEAVRAGFKDAYDRDDYETIVSVGDKLPEKVLQEDEKLLMYYDVALMRRG